LKKYGKIKLKLKKGERKMEIKKDMTIGELLEKSPEKAEILLEAGMHCLGCPASQAETIEEACEVHGIDVEQLISQLNA
jgi:hydroxylamine reductase